MIGSLRGGVSVNGSDISCTLEMPAVLKISSVTYGRFNPNECKAIFGKELLRAKETPVSGNILISRSNTSKLVGASVYVCKDYPNRYLPDKLWQTEIAKDVQVCTKWLAFVLSSAKVRYQLSQLATGTLRDPLILSTKSVMGTEGGQNKYGTDGIV